MDLNFLTLIMIILVLYISYEMFKNSETFQLSCIISDINGKKYCVRDRKDKDAAADLLAEVSIRLKKLVNYLIIQYPDDIRTLRLKKKI